MIEEDKAKYKDGVDEFVLLVDTWGYTTFLRDLQTVHPDCYKHLMEAMMEQRSRPRIAALLRERGHDRLV